MSFFANSQVFSFGLEKQLDFSGTDREMGKPSDLTEKFLKSTEHEGSILTGNFGISPTISELFLPEKMGK